MPTMGPPTSTTSAPVPAPAQPGALIRANEAMTFINIASLKAAVQSLLRVIQILRFAITLFSRAAWVSLRQPLAGVCTLIASSESFIVLRKRLNDDVIILPQMVPQLLRPGVHIGTRALLVATMVRVVVARHLHQPAGAVTRIYPSITERLLHGDGSEDNSIDAVPAA